MLCMNNNNNKIVNIQVLLSYLIKSWLFRVLFPLQSILENYAILDNVAKYYDYLKYINWHCYVLLPQICS